MPPLTMEAVLGFGSVADVQLQPGGNSFAFVSADSHTSLLSEGHRPPQRFSRSALWLASTKGAQPRRLTSGPRSDSLPRWSPDGTKIAFLSDRGRIGQRQIMVLDVVAEEAGSAGEDDGAKALTDLRGDIPSPRGLNAVQWTPDGKSIVFLLEESPATKEAKRELGDDAIEYEKEPAFVRLMRVDLATKLVSVISPRAAGQIWELRQWSPPPPTNGAGTSAAS